MAMNFMKIDQVVMSGDGFYQSMAYHAYQSLPLASFALQCVLCVLSIATGYAVRRWVLAPLSAPPAGSTARGRIVCNCHNVAESEICAEVARGADLPALQAKLKCGTDCGSCMPELKQLVKLRKAA